MQRGSANISKPPHTNKPGANENQRATGIEPAWPAWKAGTLPLSYARLVQKLKGHLSLVISQSEGARLRRGLLFLKCGSDQCRVVTAKAEGVIESDAHFLFAGDVRCVIEIA